MWNNHEKKHKLSKEQLFVVLAIVFSVVVGWMSNDLLVGGSILATGLTSAYFASQAKRINYLLGCGNYLLMAYVSWQNHIYGIALFYTLLFAPLQLKGFFTC